MCFCCEMFNILGKEHILTYNHCPIPLPRTDGLDLAETWKQGSVWPDCWETRLYQAFSFALALFSGSSTAWMMGKAPPWAMVTPARSLLSSSSFLHIRLDRQPIRGGFNNPSHGNFLLKGQGSQWVDIIDHWSTILLNGRHSWICGRYYIKMVRIIKKSLRMVIWGKMKMENRIYNSPAKMSMHFLVAKCVMLQIRTSLST